MRRSDGGPPSWGAPGAPLSPRHGLGQRLAAHLTLIVFLAGIGPGGALGTETALGHVDTTHGQGEFTANTETLTEFSQHSPQAILDWQTDIQQPAHHSLEFRQGEGFAVLNRSPGERASDFWGRVVCDATCVFTNRAGIHFQDGSFVDVGQVIAAAGDLSSADFLAGNYRFTGLDGRVTNAGRIGGGSIALLGRSVANFGQIETPDGAFVMAAGDEIFLREHDSPIVIRSSLSAPRDFNDGPAVENTGTVEAGTGHVRLAAGDMLSFAIRNTGTLRGGTLRLEGGEGGLVEVMGTLDASDRDAATDPESATQGGTIDVFGDFVSIQDGARLDASGAGGGGRVRVGGGYQGGDDAPTARSTFVHPGAEIRADASERGDGGELIVWADEIAQIYGTLSATGGPLGGSGGFAETSGKLWLDVTSAPNLRALSGAPGDVGGDWLIDPNNISIVESPCVAADPSCLDLALDPNRPANPLFEFNGGPVIRPTVNDSVISAGLIAGALEDGTSVTILTDTIATEQGNQNGNISVEAAIAPEAAKASPGSQATLTLLAANDLIINRNIGVVADPNADATATSDLVLNIILAAGDLSQSQNPASANAIPNSFVGTLQINADTEDAEGVGATLNSAGGAISLSAAGSGEIDLNIPNPDPYGVVAAADTTIRTDGGALGISTFGGDITLNGTVDTTTMTRDDEGNELRGGAVAMFSEAARVPNTVGQDPITGAPIGTAVRGGNITLRSTGTINTDRGIDTDGGTVTLFTTGGDVTIDGQVDTSVVEALATPVSGGNVEIRARRTEYAPLVSGDSAVTTGGGITLGANGIFRTQGGGVALGLDATSSTASANQITVNGLIDTTDTTGTGDAIGGAVFFDTSGADASVSMLDAQIVTAGGRIQSVGTGSFQIEDSTLDARSLQGLDPDLAVSDIGIFHVGDINIGESTGTTLLAADQAVQISPGLASGTGNMTFTGSPEIIAEEVLLEVGDGFEGESTSASIELGAADFHSHGGLNAAPLRFSLVQEASFNTADANILNRIAGGNLAALEQYTLAASDGILTVGDPGAIADPDPVSNLELRLSAGEGIAVEGAFAPDSLALLQLELEQGFTVGADLADAISGAAADLVIAAGTPAVAENPSLLIQGGLSASESIVLHAGTGGEGDLAFAPDPLANPLTLTSANITLWAGDGDSTGSAAVRSETLAADSANVLFEIVGTPETPPAFTLRQDAPIDDTTVPDLDRFTNGVAGVDYTLRSDGAGVAEPGIALGTDGAAGLIGSRLSLHALGPIDLSAIPNDGLEVQSLDIGGLGDFTYTQAINDKILFTDPGTDLNRLVIRAGLVNPGTLNFDGGLILEADAIRLVAGDGVGGNQGEDASSIVLPQGAETPIFQGLGGAALEEFVFRQDASIAQSDLPTLAANFGGNTPGQGSTPSRLAIRSDADIDEGGIALTDFPAAGAPLLQASETLILSAAAVTLTRTDGQNLVIDDVLQGGSGTLGLQIRSDDLFLSATGGDGDRVVLPGSNLRLTAFDSDAATTGLVPAAFDFDAVPADAPALISIDQGGDLLADPLAPAGSQNFINPATQLGLAGNAALNGVFFTSRNGSITLTPTSVSGSDLTLSLESSDSLPNATRTIAFDGAAFDLNSLVAVNPFGWTVERAGNGNEGNPTNLSLRSEGLLQLSAGLSNTGNLDFEGDVVLDAQTLVLTAGDDPLLAPDSESLPVVIVRDVGGAPTVTLRLHDLEGGPASLQIRQHGSFLDSEAAAVADGLVDGEWSLIPLMSPDLSISQVVMVDTAGVPLNPQPILNQLQLDSIAGDIRIHRMIDFAGPGDPVPALNARNILLGAGVGPNADNTVHLEQNDGHNLDLSAGSTDFAFDSFVIFAPRIEFVTTSAYDPSPTAPDPPASDLLQGRIMAENNNLLLLGATIFGSGNNLLPTSPNALLFEQTASFDESSGDCTNGCLPNPATQLGPGGADGVDYTIRTVGVEADGFSPAIPGGSIRIGDTLSSKLSFSALTLDAFASGTGPDVILEASASAIDFDLILESLTVGTDSAAPIQILLQGLDSGNSTNDPKDPNNPELAVLTLNDQIYNGNVEVDRRVELAGRVVHVTGSVEAADDPADNPATTPDDELVVGVRSQALLDGNVGTHSQLERLQINFDPSAVADPAQLPTLGLGGDSAATLTLAADTIEILNSGDLAGNFNTHTPRSALASTIFKRAGDLNIVADDFAMGMGEKLSVAGNLSITARAGGNGQATLGDLSALTIQVDADTIEIQRRAGGQYIDSNGAVRSDGGVDYVANTIDFAGTIELTGGGANPVFGIQDPRSAPPWMSPYPTFQSQPNGAPLTAANFAIPPGGYVSLADLHPSGGSGDDPSTMFIESEVVPLPAAWVAAPWLPFNHASVEELGIDVQPMSPGEYRSQLNGATVIDDLGQGMMTWAGGPLRVSDARIEGTDAARAVALLNELLGPQRGRALRVRSALQNALDQYLRTSGARRVVGFELRRFVKNRPSSLFAAYKALEDLDLLFALHRGLGLTPGEYRPIQAGWLEAIRPEGITTRELAEAIQPSRYVRGSDVLDIFGE